MLFKHLIFYTAFFKNLNKEIKMTTISPRESFNFIKQTVQNQIDRLLTHGDSDQWKVKKIREALDRLCRATIEKYPQGVEIRSRLWSFIELDNEEIAEIDLTTADAMLDAEISIWESEIAPSIEQGMEFDGRRAGYRTQISLRTALNIARYNIFNSFLWGTWGPLWGKSEALELVEAELN